MFVFSFAILSAITPPVCGAVFIASGIAGASWMETARYSLRLSYAAFLLPFVFVSDNSVLLLGASPLGAAAGILRTSMAMFVLSAGFIGQLRGPVRPLGRLLLLGLGILWIVNHWAWDLLGLVGTVLVLLDRRWIYRPATRA